MRCGRAAAVLTLVGLVVACGGSSDDALQPATTNVSPTTTRTASTTATTEAPSTGTTGPTTPTPTSTPTTLPPPACTAPSTVPEDAGPLQIEDAAVAVWAVWPAVLGSPGPTRLRSFVPAADDAPPRDGESLPPTPGVPHGYTQASGGPYVVRVTAYEFGDPGAAAGWVGSWAEFGPRPPIERHGGATLIQPAPVADDGGGWSGLVLDRVQGGTGAARTWVRTAHLVKAAESRAFQVQVQWTGAADGEVPELVAPAREVATAQDRFAASIALSDDRPGAGAADLTTRTSPVDTLLPWANLTGRPGMDPPRRWEEYATANLAVMPAETAADRPDLFAERFLVGDNGRPLVVAVLAFPSAEDAQAAVARWDSSEASFGPFAFADIGVTGPVQVEAWVGTPVPEVGGTSYGIDFTSGGQPLTIGGGWFVRGTSVYAAVVSYPEGRDRNAEVALGLLVEQSQRLNDLGWT